MVPIFFTICVWEDKDKSKEDTDQFYRGELWINLEEMKVFNRRLTFSFEVGEGISKFIIYRDYKVVASIRNDSGVQNIFLEESYGFGEIWLLVQISKLVEGAILIFNTNLLFSSTEKTLTILRTSLRLPPSCEERAHELFYMLCR